MKNRIKIRTIFILISMLLISIGCKSKSIDPNHAYEDFRKDISGIVFKNFPKTIYPEFKIWDITYAQAINHNVNYCGVIFETSPKIINFSDKIMRLKSIAKFEGRINDNALIQITCKNDSLYYNNLDLKNIKDKFFVPNITEKYSLFRDKNLSNAELIIFDSSVGNFFIDKSIKHSNNFPKIFSQGYSKGAFIDYDKSIIYYWLIIW